MKTLKKTILYIWQFPQNILGVLLVLLTHPSRVIDDDGKAVIRSSYRMHGGISLGRYIVINTYQCRTQTIRHELGHSRQSRMLGPAYLLVIGIPSLLWAWLHSRLAPGKSYYRFYTEKWADRLGRVER